MNLGNNETSEFLLLSAETSKDRRSATKIKTLNLSPPLILELSLNDII